MPVPDQPLAWKFSTVTQQPTPLQWLELCCSIWTLCLFLFHFQRVLFFTSPFKMCGGGRLWLFLSLAVPSYEFIMTAHAGFQASVNPYLICSRTTGDKEGAHLHIFNQGLTWLEMQKVVIQGKWHGPKMSHNNGPNLPAAVNPAPLPTIRTNWCNLRSMWFDSSHDAKFVWGVGWCARTYGLIRLHRVRAPLLNSSWYPCIVHEVANLINQTRKTSALILVFRSDHSGRGSHSRWGKLKWFPTWQHKLLDTQGKLHVLGEWFAGSHPKYWKCGEYFPYGCFFITYSRYEISGRGLTTDVWISTELGFYVVESLAIP